MLKSSVCEKGTPRVGTIIFSGCLASNGFGMVRVAPWGAVNIIVS